MNFIKKAWLKSRWIVNPAFAEGELLRKNNRIKQGLVMGMRLAVLEEQAAAVIVEGRLISVFLPGAYQLEQDKMPPLQPHPRQKWLFPAELYFLNLAPAAQRAWQPRQTMLTRDPERGLVQLHMCGSYVAQVENATLFMSEMVLKRGLGDWAAVHDYICARLNDFSINLAARQQMPLARLAKLKEKTALYLAADMRRELRGSGLILRDLQVDTLELHPSVQRLLEEGTDYVDFNQSRLRAILG